MTPRRSTAESPRRRLSPDDRRQEIIDAARPLFAERPLSEITTANVAEAAGVARSLVHHYFGGISNLFLAVVAEGGAALADRRTLEPPAPLEERLAFNIPAGMDVVLENRETWYAAMGHAHSSGNAQVDALSAAATGYDVQRSLEVNSDLVSDTPVGRAAIHCLLHVRARSHPALA